MPYKRLSHWGKLHASCSVLTGQLQALHPTGRRSEWQFLISQPGPAGELHVLLWALLKIYSSVIYSVYALKWQKGGCMLPQISTKAHQVFYLFISDKKYTLKQLGFHLGSGIQTCFRPGNSPGVSDTGILGFSRTHLLLQGLQNISHISISSTPCSSRVSCGRHSGPVPAA